MRDVMLVGPDQHAEVVALRDLPLSGDGTVGVAGAVAAWRQGRSDALERDLRAQHAVELEQARREAYLAGVADGKAAADAEGLELLRGLPAQVDKALRDARKAARTAVDVQAGQMVAAALEVASWALGRELARDREALLAVAARALQEYGGVADARLTVAPSIAEAARAWADRCGFRGLEVCEDASLQPGQVLLRAAGGGRAEVSLESLVRRAAEALGVDADSPAAVDL